MTYNVFSGTLNPAQSINPLVLCRLITTCASRLNYIHSCAYICNGTVPGYLQSRQRLRSSAGCLPLSGSTASSSVYCRQASLSCVRRQHTRTFHPTSLGLQRHSRFSYSVLKHSYFPVHTRASSLDLYFLTASVDLAIIGSQPSDHYFRSVCWFVCLFVCSCSFSQPSLIRFRSN